MLGFCAELIRSTTKQELYLTDFLRKFCDAFSNVTYELYLKTFATAQGLSSSR